MIISELGRGTYSDCFKVCSANQAVALKLSYYRDATIRAVTKSAQRGDHNAAVTAKDQDAISVAMAMAQVAKLMKCHMVSPHIVRVYCEADARYLPLRLKALLGNRLPTLSRKQLKYAHVCLMDLHSCNMTRLLLKHQTDDCTLRKLLFQVVYTLACLQAIFPGFRHNDLSTNNVLIRRMRKTHLVTVAYDVSGARFLVSGPLVAAIADFDFTHVPGHHVLSNERVLGGKYNISPAPNNSYDTHMLLASILKCLVRSKQCPQTTAFIMGLGLDRSERLSRCLPHMYPTALLGHPYFAELRTSGAPAHHTTYTLPT